MRMKLRVVALSESFGELWPQLAASAGVELAAEGGAEGGEHVCATLLAAGGAEAAALAYLAHSDRDGDATAVVGADTGHRVAAATVRAGADDYFALPGDLAPLHSWVEARAERCARAARAERLVADERAEFDFAQIIGRSPRLREALERAKRVIPQGAATVLIRGETGTGKDLLAQAIHYHGPRAAHPFVEVNCAALPANLMEAELFGYEKGAFTDARAAKPGLLETAHRGTLFLDEIGDLALELQAKLLRVLDKKRVRRLGSVRDQEVDVRIIAASHLDLSAQVRERRFREDLFYRLNVIALVLPPLRERGDDVVLLAEHFADHFSRDYAVPRPAFTPAVRRALASHSWPGNVRELRNSIERATILGGGTLREDDLFPAGLAAAPSGEGPLPFPATLDQIQRAAARAMLEECGGNKTRAAERLGVSRKGLYALLAAGNG
ncbi:MAG TPA: sigma 54-interacting transcriptional regulator [Longimicrobium sp.]|nr:sigma 54-interacting transcriptional regulator [Longimicrobium sp.]